MPESIACALEHGHAHPARRLIAAGIIRRTPGRTLTVRVTPAGVTGVIAKQVTR
ncbi:hypothetical protein ACFVGX_36775 [Streptomyces sp. NPDC127113]|uniref:hypothetical protein n=1 Tax=Streptomyces sp. NPDC127113 TaxID=3345365 RepID=UPI003643912B